MFPKTKQEYKDMLRNLRRKRNALRKKLEEEVSDYDFLIKNTKRLLSLFKAQERIA